MLVHPVRRDILAAGRTEHDIVIITAPLSNAYTVLKFVGTGTWRHVDGVPMTEG